MKERALDLHVVLQGILASYGPGVRSIALSVYPSWDSVQIRVADDAAVHVLAEDLGLDAPAVEKAGPCWWTTASGAEARLHISVMGPVTVESGAQP